ncbi:hypothetical protein BGX31_007622 [Mortierella sp. GBA43]|nr:hypothetical protein BGX31_007622 [Mortierella sp. GBA43]
MAICEDGDESAVPFCQRGGDNRMKSLFPDDETEQSMSDVGGSFLSCSYCSSVRSNSVASLDDNQRHHSLHQQPTSREHEQNTLLNDTQRKDHLKNLVPTEVRCKLSAHVDECWFVHFSPSAEYMSTVGLDYTINLWQNLTSPEPTVFRTLNFTRTITHVDWSPNSKYLLVNFGHDLARPELIPEVNLIDVESGEIVLKRRNKTDTHYVPAPAIGWFPDSERFVTALDDGIYRIWNVQGEVVKEYAVGKNLTASHMRMISGKDEAVIITKDNTIEVISFADEVSSRQLDRLTAYISSSAISMDGAYFSVGIRADKELLRPAQIALYDLNTMTFLRSFEADTYTNDAFMIIPSFVGPNQELLCAGSESGKLTFWDIESGEFVEVLEEHTMHAGCTAANSHYSGMMASCSDDNLVIIWVTKDLQRELQDEDEKWMSKHPRTVPPVLGIKKNW